MHTLSIISGREAHRYNNEPIIERQTFWLTGLPSLVKSRCPLVGMGVFIPLLSFMLNLLKRSLVYFICETNVPSLVCLIYKPRKYLSSLVIDISNFSDINLPNFSLKWGLLEPNMASST